MKGHTLQPPNGVLVRDIPVRSMARGVLDGGSTSCLFALNKAHKHVVHNLFTSLDIFCG